MKILSHIIIGLAAFCCLLSPCVPAAAEVTKATAGAGVGYSGAMAGAGMGYGRAMEGATDGGADANRQSGVKGAAGTVRMESPQIPNALGGKLNEYLLAIERESAEVKCQEADFLIGVCMDSLIRQKVALAVYGHFLESPVMGDEAVAIHVYDTWFADGKVAMGSEAELWAAKLHAGINRRSLIGCRAEELTLYTPEGREVRLFGGAEDGEINNSADADAGNKREGTISGKRDAAGRMTVLYFYDTGCPQCLLTSMQLNRTLGGGGLVAGGTADGGTADGGTAGNRQAGSGRLVAGGTADGGTAGGQEGSGKIGGRMESGGKAVDFYAVYVGSEREKWEEYRSQRLNADGIVHLWDPDGISGMNLKYAVINTPQLFLIDPAGIIIGRRLDADALKRLLEAQNPQMEYGSEAAMQMFDALFAGDRRNGAHGAAEEEDGNSSAHGATDAGGGLGERRNKDAEGGRLGKAAEYIASVTLERGDTLMFKQLTGDLLYYASNQRGEGFKCSLPAFAEKYILGRPDIWKSTDDSLKVVSLAELLHSIGSLSPVGSRLPSLKVPAEIVKVRRIVSGKTPDIIDIYATGSGEISDKTASDSETPNRANSSTASGGTAHHADGRKLSNRADDHEAAYRTGGNARIAELRHKNIRLDRQRNATIIFYTEGCSICKEEKAAALRMKAEGKIGRLIYINMDTLWSSQPDLAEALMQSFDLSSLPFIILTDRCSRLLRKYLSFTE